jgi:heme oxygenase (mycobilin-producing)
MTVTLINPFEVPKGKEDDALAYWERCDAIMKKAPGFISTHL